MCIQTRKRVLVKINFKPSVISRTPLSASYMNYKHEYIIIYHGTSEKNNKSIRGVFGSCTCACTCMMYAIVFEP